MTEREISTTGSMKSVSEMIHGPDSRLSSTGPDEALKALDGSETVILTPEKERALLWKIDLHLIPIFSLLYGLQFLDKTTISYAAVMDIMQDTHLKGDNFNWLGSVFYFGYLFWEYPANYLMQKLPLAKFTGFNIVVWGAILMLHAACSNFAGLATVRFFLGVFEASISPAFLLFVSQWWRVREQAFRTSMWFCWNGVAQIVGAVCSYAMVRGIDKHGYTALGGWQLLFLATGGLTILAGILFLFIIPDSPATAWFLTREERIMAIERLRENNQGFGSKKFKKQQFIEAFTDPQTYYIATFVIISSIPNGFLTTFKNIIFKGFGLTAEKSLLYGAPNGAVQIVSTLLFGWLADKYQNRMVFATVAMAISLLGFALAVALPRSNLNGNLAAYYLISASPASFILLVSCISSNVAGYTKKTTVSAIVFIAYCVGNLIGPHTINLKDGPMYVKAKTISLIAWCISAAILIALRFYYTRSNAARDKKMRVLGDCYQHQENQEFMDLTDRENLEFRYTY
ncbi:MFS general substrate transporter [Choiromyces venosus 120613-1]|uniref:MFS general substrate transporter n=1 Tax=Choiromyces venosus 120613-1 TaxID=1336337 RepID=A0A3N4K4U5_9PEZI|nr:MFS general substrate transporter [Choiromyces venosus 120613-1]